ncbi:hypothetical protein TNCV_317961 [Trichonephila clavipes]|nr:hypothetical protein TNCV_317961 [Trichonephila clavipes]
MDETWVHPFIPETKEQSKQWNERGEPASKKAKTVPSAVKVDESIRLQVLRNCHQSALIRFAKLRDLEDFTNCSKQQLQLQSIDVDADSSFE